MKCLRAPAAALALLLLAACSADVTAPSRGAGRPSFDGGGMMGSGNDTPPPPAEEGAASTADGTTTPSDSTGTGENSRGGASMGSGN